MRFVFVSTTCSENEYSKIFRLRTKRIIDPMQKFLLQLMRGISADENNTVESISVKPVSFSCFNDRRIEYSSDTEENIDFYYIPFINGKYLRFITTFFSVIYYSNKLLKDSCDTIVITDPLNPYISIPTRIIAGLKHVKTVAIVTDLPLLATKMKNRKERGIKKYLRNLFEYISSWDSKKYDAYIFLTEYMNKAINKKNKPYIVIEGSAVASDNSRETITQSDKRIFMYAGGVYEKYGVKRLVEAFRNASFRDTELHIYGEGTYVEELKKICETNGSIHYCGCVLNSDLIKLEETADLLINPRFSDEEFTKYSFPSKTLEYLSSGTPVLSTRLIGIPNEYIPYLFWFEDESQNGMKNKLIEINAMSDKELREKGNLGKDFVLKHKSNIVQGKKIIAFSSCLIE